MALRKDIEVFKKLKSKKTVSLNLDARWNEYLKEKKFYEEQSKLLRLDDEDDKKNSSAKKMKDLYIDESMNIMRDYISVQSGTLKTTAGK